jgi:protein required for attachment to host cells
MQLRHNTLLVVADGRKALFLRNEGDAVHPNLVVEHAEEHLSPANRDQKTDRAGRAFSSVGDGRNAMEETDFHQLEQDRFAAELGATLKTRALNNDFESLIIAAPPRTLGELRKHYHVEVEKRLAGEIPKDLTGHPVPEIEKLVSAD